MLKNSEKELTKFRVYAKKELNDVVLESAKLMIKKVALLEISEDDIKFFMKKVLK